MSKSNGWIAPAILGGAISWFIAKILDALWPHVFGFIAGQEGAIIACGMIGGIIGFFFGWNAKGSVEHKDAAQKPRRVTRKEKRALKEQKKERIEQSRSDAASTIMQLNPDDRALLVVMAAGMTAYGRGMDWRCPYWGEEFFAQFFKVAYMDGDIAKITATPLLEQLFSDYPDLKEGVSETIDHHKATSAQAGLHAVVSYGDRILPYWWWTE